MLPEIWSTTDIFFWHFGPFFALLSNYWPWKLNFGKNVKNTWRYYLFTEVYHKWRSYDICFLRYTVWRTAFCVVWGHFLLFDPPNNPKNRNLDQMKKARRYDHFALVCHKWRWYGVWFLRYGARRTECFVNMDYFLPFYPTKNPRKSKFWKNEEQRLEISSFYTSVPKVMIRWYTVSEI